MIGYEQIDWLTLVHKAQCLLCGSGLNDGESQTLQHVCRAGADQILIIHEERMAARSDKDPCIK